MPETPDHKQKTKYMDWGGGSALEIMDALTEDLQPCGSSQPFIPPVPRGPVPTSSCDTHIYIYIYI